MKDLRTYIYESNDKINHSQGRGTGLISIGKNCTLCYTDDVETYPILSNNAFELSEIYVPKEDRKKGIATKLINYFIDFAKSKNKDIVLYASPLDEDMKESELFEFYKNRGFKNDTRTNDKHCFIYKIREN